MHWVTHYHYKMHFVIPVTSDFSVGFPLNTKFCSGLQVPCTIISLKKGASGRCKDCRKLKKNIKKIPQLWVLTFYGEMYTVLHNAPDIL